jgi:hypothetical protein
MALSSKQRQYVDRRHATAIKLLQSGTPLKMMHRHTVGSSAGASSSMGSRLSRRGHGWLRIAGHSSRWNTW